MQFNQIRGRKKPNNSFKVISRFASHWLASVSAFASQIVCTGFSCPLDLRYVAQKKS
jgi:hypothetical protein